MGIGYFAQAWSAWPGAYTPRAMVAKARALSHVVPDLGGLATTTSPGRGVKLCWTAIRAPAVEVDMHSAVFYSMYTSILQYVHVGVLSCAEEREEAHVDGSGKSR
jgi:hypothetical protein